MSKVLLKQYGERRTGTNYLRALVLANYANAIPLMHVLGDKHSPPADFSAHWKDASAEPNAFRSFIRSTTWAVPAETTLFGDAEQLQYLDEVADETDGSFRPDQLGFLISVKHPYAWAASMARYSRWLDQSDGTMGLEHANTLKFACEHYNARHRSWLELHRRSGDRSVIVRHETLLEEPRGMLRLLERRFGLIRTNPEPILIQERTGPTHWDDHPVNYEPAPFDANVYRERSYQRLLSDEMWEWVRKKIDWSLAAEFGYRELHFRA